MSTISAAALNRAADAPNPIDAFTLPGDIPDAPGEASAADACALVPGTPSGPPQSSTLRGTPSEDWRARGLAHPAGRGWEVVTPAAAPKSRSDSPAYTSLAAELLAEPEEARPVFTRALQVQFLHALAACGAVRRASARVGVSYRTVYRERRASRAFALAWDAALIAARAVHADVLATRAIDGVEEIVWFRGEEVGRRVRYDSRLLLAHLARLDKLCEDGAAGAIAEDFDGALERFEAGEELAAPEAEVPSPGHRDKCDTSGSAAAGSGPAIPAGPALAEDGQPLEWCPHVRKMLHPDLVLRNEMYAQRPDGVRPTSKFPGFDEWEVEAEQMAAFDADVDRWWLIVPPGPNDDPEEWVYFEEAA